MSHIKSHQGIRECALPPRLCSPASTSTDALARAHSQMSRVQQALLAQARLHASLHRHSPLRQGRPGSCRQAAGLRRAGDPPRRRHGRARQAAATRDERRRHWRVGQPLGDAQRVASARSAGTAAEHGCGAGPPPPAAALCDALVRLIDLDAVPPDARRRPPAYPAAAAPVASPPPAAPRVPAASAACPAAPRRTRHGRRRRARLAARGLCAAPAAAGAPPPNGRALVAFIPVPPPPSPLPLSIPPRHSIRTYPFFALPLRPSQPRLASPRLAGRSAYCTLEEHTPRAGHAPSSAPPRRPDSACCPGLSLSLSENISTRCCCIVLE